MTAHIINIGDELLIGQVVNTNASWMAEELNKRNIKVTNISVISDGGDDIRSQLERSLSEADVVLITGGLGPTKDDITKSVLCEFFGDTLVRHQQTYDNVKKFFERRGLPFTEINQAQALVPSKCKVLVNEVGTAPCMVFTMPQVETQYIASLQTEAKPFEKIVISMPGVPFEMKWLMQNSVLPMLQERLGGEAIVHKTILTFGIGESFLADKIADWEDALPTHIKLAYLPEAGKVRLRLSAYGADHTELEREVAEQIVKLNAIIGENIYGYDDDTISSAIGKMCLTCNCRKLHQWTDCSSYHRNTRLIGIFQRWHRGIFKRNKRATIRRKTRNIGAIWCCVRRNCNRDGAWMSDQDGSRLRHCHNRHCRPNWCY